VALKWSAERERLILANRLLAHGYASHYRGWMEWDEIVSCADAALVKAADTFLRGDFSGWLHLFVRREVVGEYRRLHGSVCNAPRAVQIPTPDIEVRDERDVDDYLDFTRRLQRVPKRAAAVMLARYEGYSLHEIAIRLGVHDSRITQIVREGYARFRPS